MSIIKTSSLEQTQTLGKQIADALHGNEVIAYFGGLGAGKTTLTRAIVNNLESKDEASSPTFAIVNEYRAKFPIYHFDMYRVKSWDDLYSTGFFDYLDRGVILIEWSENIENALPENTVTINIERGDNEFDRIFTIEGLEI